MIGQNSTYAPIMSFYNSTEKILLFLLKTEMAEIISASCQICVRDLMHDFVSDVAVCGTVQAYCRSIRTVDCEPEENCSTGYKLCHFNGVSRQHSNAFGRPAQIIGGKQFIILENRVKSRIVGLPQD